VKTAGGSRRSPLVAGLLKIRWLDVSVPPRAVFDRTFPIPPLERDRPGSPARAKPALVHVADAARSKRDRRIRLKRLFGDDRIALAAHFIRFLRVRSTATRRPGVLFVDADGRIRGRLGPDAPRKAVLEALTACYEAHYADTFADRSRRFNACLDRLETAEDAYALRDPAVDRKALDRVRAELARVRNAPLENRAGLRERR
jgi:hypothetical protein